MNNTLEYEMARAGNADRWVPACGGHEMPQLYRSGRKLLYVFNFRTGKHAYIDCATDMLLSDAEAMAEMP